MRRGAVTLLAWLLVLIPVFAVRAEVGFPDTPPAQHLRAFIEAFNAEGTESIEAFDARRSEAFREQVPEGLFLTTTAQMRGIWGELTPHSWVETGEGHAVLLAKAERAQAWVRIRADARGLGEGSLEGLVIRPSAPPEAAAAPAAEWETLAELLEIERERAAAPALAAAVVVGGQVADAAAVGVRIAGGEDAVTIDDRFHVGSVSKAVNATMIGMLVEREVVDWSTTVGWALGDVEMDDLYAGATVRQLLEHKAGLPPFLRFEPDEMRRLVTLEGSPSAQREAFVAEALMARPVAPPGEEAVYSNAGPVVAAVIAERQTETPWEELVERMVFDQLGMDRSGVGWPATAARPDEPLGHAGGQPVAMDAYPLGSFMSPAGNLHMSIGDLARFARFHLLGLIDARDAERARVVRSLHEPATTLDPRSPHAAGWILRVREGEPTVHWHNGSVGTFYALVAIIPAERMAVVVAANSGDLQRVEAGAWRIVEELRERRAAAP